MASAGLLARLCRAFALAGGALLAGFSLLAVVSIAGRACCNAPLPGDYELAQVTVAVAVSLCLPWCQWKRGHIAVDFFTARLSPRWQIRLDVLGQGLLAALLALVAWRTGLGARDAWLSGETTMILAFPVWLGFAGLVPGFVLAAVAGFAGAWHDGRRFARFSS